MPYIETKVEDYYKENRFISYSGLKVFSRCETLYRDQFLLQTYSPPEQEYFVYGQLVDTLLTEADKIGERFIRVERKLKVEDALKIENKIQECKQGIIERAEKVEKGNKPAIKKTETLRKEIEEHQAALQAIKELDGKQQVTPQMWEGAHATAEAIKAHPFFKNLQFNDITSQQIFTADIDGVPVKGKLDFLKLPPSVEQPYTMWKTGLIEYAEMRKQINALPENEKWCIIVDIKTCYDIAKLEPWNYRAQLKMYQRLVFEVLGINALCMILVGDKLHDIKKQELFEFPQEVLDSTWEDLSGWMKKWKYAMDTQNFTSAKVKYGMQQECFLCTECSFCPFSKEAGKPVRITEPRFKDKQYIKASVLVSDEIDEPVAAVEENY